MSFDPFGDFETAGYLRNIAKEKDPTIIEGMEQVSVETGLDEAFAFLNGRRTIQYKHVLEVHRILFNAVYPWAGQDRMLTAPGLRIFRGGVDFARPDMIERAMLYALRLGNDPKFMATRPGEVMGQLAFAHPFLDGNGRTIMVTHTVLAERAGISINWASTNKIDYLAALTADVLDPQAGHLDRYLAPFITKAIGKDGLVTQLRSIRGLNDKSVDDEVASPEDATLRNRYEQSDLKYEQIIDETKPRDEE